jgi:hypothetical protein
MRRACDSVLRAGHRDAVAVKFLAEYLPERLVPSWEVIGLPPCIEDVEKLRGDANLDLPHPLAFRFGHAYDSRVAF